LDVIFPQTVEAAVEDGGEDHEENRQNGNEATLECCSLQYSEKNMLITFAN